MKNQKSYLYLFIIILFFSLVIQGPNTFFNEQATKENGNSTNYLSTSNSHTHEWNRTWGGSANDIGRGVTVDSSGNVYITGLTESFGAGIQDMVLVKYDSSGVQQWNRTWGGTSTDESNGVAVDSSDNVYIAGNTWSFGPSRPSMVLMKYDSSGVQQWNRMWGGSGSENSYGVAIDSSDNVYLVGRTNSFGAGGYDMVLVKYDSSGVQQWNRTWGGSANDIGRGVTVDSSDNVYLAGLTISFGAGGPDMVLVKYDSFGVQQWNKTWGGIDGDWGYAVAVDSSDNVYLAGGTASFGAGYYNMVIVKYDSSGMQQWNHTWGGNAWDWGYGVAVDSSDDVYLVGGTNEGLGGANIVLVKYDSSGVQQWTLLWDEVSYHTGFGVTVDSANNVYLAGEETKSGNTDMILVKFRIIPIKIITPESIIYSAPMSGYYPATYGFENVLDSADDPSWVDNQGSSEVISSLGGHEKVYQCANGFLGVAQEWTVDRDNGTIEFYMYNEDATEPFQIQIQRSGVGVVFALRIINNEFQFNNATGYYDVGKSVADSTWYHVRIDFETTGGNYMGLSQWYWRIYIDGELFGPYTFSNNWIPNRFACYAAPYVATVRAWDAVGYSWDSNYNIGDNLYEGLLLSYETNVDLDWFRYSLDSQNNISIFGNTTIPLPADGSHTIQVFGNNSLGNNFQSEIRYFAIDTIIPEIMIHSPIPDDFYRVIPPKYNISIIEGYLSSTWYTLDGGITNTTFSGLTGTINQTEWEKKEDGMVSIRFYANDTAGNEGYADVSIFKDVNDPEIGINDPLQDDKFGKEAPSYEISITELNLESFWYTIDGGLTNYTITQLSGTIDQTAWDAALYGSITIRFYAEDLAGNIGYSEVVVNKSEKKQEKISSYPLVLFISMIGLITALSLKKKLK